MSDPVAIALIAGLPGMLAALFSFITQLRVQRTAVHIAETKQAIVTLEKNTNSIKDELVRVTGQAEFAKGEAGKPPGFPIPSDKPEGISGMKFW